MSQYDKFVNNVLSSLIFEQTNQISGENILTQSIEEFKKNKNNPSLYKEAESKYNEEGPFVNMFENYMKDVKEKLKKEKVDESTLDDLKSGASWLWGKAKEGFEKTKEYVAPTMEDVTEYVVNNVGDWVRENIGDKYVNEINNELSESTLYKIAAVFEPTGVMSWPYLNKALELYEANKGTEDENVYFLNLLAAQLSVIPGVRLPLSVLTFPFKLLGKGLGFIPANIANGMMSVFSKNKNIPNVMSTIEKMGTSGARFGFLSRAKNFFSSILKSPTKLLKPIIKTVPKVATAAKVGTVATSGDIPKGIKDLMNPPKNDKPSVPKVSTLGRFPNFSSLSTQSF